MKSYLHVYPLGTKRVSTISDELKLPDDRWATFDWRIGINVLPDSIAAAVNTLMPIMHNYKVIHHIKFAAPGLATKSDSVIIYLLKQPDSYGRIKQAVQQAIPGRNVQAKFLPMWNEFANGFAEAAEPPYYGDSVGRFRCILAYLAYPRHTLVAATLSLSDYQARVDETFQTFGIPLYAPHEQGPLLEPPYNDPIRIRFMKALALFRGLRADALKYTRLTDRRA